MEQCWNNTDRKTEASEINLFQYYFVHHKFHVVSSTEINITYEHFLSCCFASKILHVGMEKLESQLFFPLLFIFLRPIKKLIVSLCFSIAQPFPWAQSTCVSQGPLNSVTGHVARTAWFHSILFLFSVLYPLLLTVTLQLKYSTYSHICYLTAFIRSKFQSETPYRTRSTVGRLSFESNFWISQFQS
jgi:hypothetical protein